MDTSALTALLSDCRPQTLPRRHFRGDPGSCMPDLEVPSAAMDFLFSKPGFNCIGDPYKDPPMDPYKHGTSKGRRQFLTAPPKKGQTANAIGYGPLAYKPMYLPGKEP